MSEMLASHKLILLMIVLICVDVMTGIINALKEHSLKSAIMREGGYKKFLSLVICLMSYSLDKVYFNADVLYTLTTSFYLLYESISILENLGKMGVPIPTKIKGLLYNLKSEVEEGDDNNE